MARPAKTPTEQRTKTAKFRLTEAELIQLDALAANDRLTVSDYLRGKALGATPRQVKASAEQLAFIQALGTLGHIRADLNQVLKDRWSYKFVSPERAEAIFAAIERIADAIYPNLPDDGY